MPDVSGCDVIDREVYAKLRSPRRRRPRARAEDAEFLRRVTLDVIGTLPTPGKVRAFLADGSCDKRSRTDRRAARAPDARRALGHALPRHHRLRRERHGGPARASRPPGPALARLVPRAVRREYPLRPRSPAGCICATSRDGQDARAWARREAEQMQSSGTGDETDYARQAGARLLLATAGQRASRPRSSRWPSGSPRRSWACASNAPSATSTRSTAGPRPTTGAFANIVADVQFGLCSRGPVRHGAALLDERRKADPNGTPALDPPAPRGLSSPPGPPAAWPTPTPAARSPRAPWAGPELPDDGDPRQRALRLAGGSPRTPTSPAASSTASGRSTSAPGLVDPVDGFSVTNPPSNPRLLNALAADFVVQGYDIRRLERLILNSRAYQRSSQPVALNLDDHGNFARAMPRPLMAEVLVDAINAALDLPGDFGPDAPKGSRAIEIATNRVASPDLARAFRILGRPERAAVCDCERPKAPALPQTLFLMTDDALLARLKSGRVEGAGRFGPLRRGGGRGAFPRRPVSPPGLGRGPVGPRPSPDEARPRTGLADVLWALINTREFVLNH